MATDHEHASYLGNYTISDLCCHVRHDILAVALINVELSLSERTGVSKEIKTALGELVQKRPRDPLSYLARQYPWGIASACSYVNTVHDEHDDVVSWVSMTI